VEVQLHIFLTSALDGDEWSASDPDCFNPGENPPLDTGWVGSRPCLNGLEKKHLDPAKSWTLIRQWSSLATLSTELSWLLIIYSDTHTNILY